MRSFRAKMPLPRRADALELRELRLRMKHTPRIVIGHWCFVIPISGRGPAWGTDEETAQQWPRVTDNGVGMTEEVIKGYFTQIDNSSYRRNLWQTR